MSKASLVVLRTSFPARLYFHRLIIGLNGPVLTKCNTDESDRHQCGPGDHQPMRIFDRGEHGLFTLRLRRGNDYVAVPQNRLQKGDKFWIRKNGVGHAK
jgi:hypothetical protein